MSVFFMPSGDVSVSAPFPTMPPCLMALMLSRSVVSLHSTPVPVRIVHEHNISTQHTPYVLAWWLVAEGLCVEAHGVSHIDSLAARHNIMDA